MYGHAWSSKKSASQNFLSNFTDLTVSVSVFRKAVSVPGFPTGFI